ncbi:MAG: ATP-binding protein [Patescibacteria group bacterium]|nr:ATP-binding protein [Patescibacteria group bacterium]
MIRKVSYTNFYSFNKKQEISFLAKKKKTYDYFRSETGDQITKVSGFVGANASGKTNVMRLFSFLSYFVCRDINESIPTIQNSGYKAFFNNNRPSDFYIEFEVDNLVVFYEFRIQGNTILSESMVVKEIKKGSRKLNIFHRELDNIEIQNNDFLQNLSPESLPKIREDVSFITYVKGSSYSIDLINIVYDYFARFQTNINEKGEINNLPQQFLALDLYHNDPVIKEEMERFIRTFDVGLKGFEIIKKEHGQNCSITVQGIHSTKEEKNKLDFAYESKGTQSLFFVMARIIKALKTNSVVVLDEIETGFHPEALNKLISYFISENKDGKAQLIFSSHSLGFMNKLDMHQIYLVERNNLGVSNVFRLNQIEEIRSDENFLSKYLAGSYGAFPKIRS